MKEDKYSVRLFFSHGNSIVLQLKGCGSLTIKPGHDYFFENAPMKFINYLAQLRRLGVTYKITQDKRGCYQTVNLAGYFSNDRARQLNSLREKTPVDFTQVGKNLDKIKEKPEQEVVIDSTKGDPIDSVVSTIKQEDLITLGGEIPESSETHESVENKDGIKQEDVISEDVETPEPSETPESTENKDDLDNGEGNVDDVEVDRTPIDLDNQPTKAVLLERARALGIVEVEDSWVKKDISLAINKKLTESK